MKIDFDIKIEEFLNICKENNIEVYLVGGFLRDYLNGIKSYDMDFALTSSYDEALNVLKKYYKCDHYDRYQSIKLNIGEYRIEISHCRKEDEYNDYRHPSKIAFINDINKDSQRRDFTINALYYKDGNLYDFYGSYEDIHNKKLNVIGDTLTRFNEDALRILRMIRFASLGYLINNKDKQIILNNALLVKHLSLNAFETEFNKILMIGNLDIINTYKRVFETYYELDFADISKLNEFKPLKDKKIYLNIDSKEG